MQHRLPYDERRLYRLLGLRRGDIWRWLRDPAAGDPRSASTAPARPPAATAAALAAADAYNGPPPLVSPRESPATASSYSNNAAISFDGRRLAFEGYEAKLAIARTRDEIAGHGPPVLARAAGAGEWVDRPAERDLAAGRTQLTSVGDGANRYVGPTKGSSTGGDAFVLCA